jgi:hypothetical protein
MGMSRYGMSLQQITHDNGGSRDIFLTTIKHKIVFREMLIKYISSIPTNIPTNKETKKDD